MKNVFQNIRESMKNMVNDMKDKSAEFVGKYIKNKLETYDKISGMVDDFKSRVRNVFSSAVTAVGDANSIYEMRMLNPLADPVDQYKSILNDDKKTRNLPLITRDDIIGSKSEKVGKMDDLKYDSAQITIDIS